MINLMEIVGLAENEIAKRGNDYRYTSEPLYVEKKRCVNVLFDFMEGANRENCDVSDVNMLEGKTNFRPGCLVGSIALNYTNMGWFMAKGLNGVSSYELFDRLKEDGLADISPLSTVFLRVVQASQDNGDTWGEAFWKGMQEVLKVADNHEHAKALPEERLYLESIFGSPRPVADKELSAA